MNNENIFALPTDEIGLRLKDQTKLNNDSKGYYRTKEMLRADLLRMVYFLKFISIYFH